MMPVSSSVIMGLWWQWKVFTRPRSVPRMGLSSFSPTKVFMADFARLYVIQQKLGLTLVGQDDGQGGGDQ